MDLRERHVTRHDDGRRHPWETVRGEFLTDLVIRHRPVARPLRVTDVGSGDGWLAEQLRNALGESTTVACWDVHYTDDDLAEVLPEGLSRSRHAPSEPAHVVTAFDVLEHVPDAGAFLHDEVRPTLRDDGVLVVSVPAHQVLFTAHDRALGHVCRYSWPLLVEQLSVDFDIVTTGSLFSSLIPPRALSVARERARGQRAGGEQHGIRSGWEHGPGLTALVAAALRIDTRLFGRPARPGQRPLVPGLSLWAVAVPKVVR